MNNIKTIYYRARFGGWSAVTPPWAHHIGTKLAGAGILAFSIGAVAARTL